MRKMTISAWTLVASMSLLGTASAQQAERQRPQAGAKQQAQQKPQQDPQATKAMTQLHAIHQVESELALGAINNAEREEVREYANRITQEHQEWDRELMEQAHTLGLEVAPSRDAQRAIQQLRQQFPQLSQRLQQARGAQFDRTFVDGMVQTHEHAISQVRQLSQQVQNQEVKQYLQERLQGLQEHLESAQQLQQELRQGQRQQR